MYEIRSEAKEFIGETGADARTKAVSFFGIDESEITFHELASSEVSGVGARTVIVAQPTEMVGKMARAGGGENRSTERERPGRERGSGRERSGRGRGDRGPREGRGRGDREPREGRGRGDREPREARPERDREPREARPERDREPRPAPAEPSVGTPQGDRWESSSSV